jgi:hypothetical protein
VHEFGNLNGDRSLDAQVHQQGDLGLSEMVWGHVVDIQDTDHLAAALDGYRNHGAKNLIEGWIDSGIDGDVRNAQHLTSPDYSTGKAVAVGQTGRRMAEPSQLKGLAHRPPVFSQQKDHPTGCVGQTDGTGDYLSEDVTYALQTNDPISDILQKGETNRALYRYSEVLAQDLNQLTITLSEPAELVLVGANDTDRLLTDPHRYYEHRPRLISFFARGSESRITTGVCQN